MPAIQTRQLLLGAILAVATSTAAASSRHDEAYLEFKGAIGVDPLTAAGITTPDVVNTVRGINPGGRAWVIRKLEAKVNANAMVSISGKGLLFSSGEAIATRGTVTHVAATLACGPADATATKYTTAPSPLDTMGNFTIRGPLLDGANTAVLPATCDNPQLLIRAANPTTGAPGGWFAAGILRAHD